MSPEVEHFVDILPEPCVLLTAGGSIVHANAAAAELIGADRNDLAGKSFRDFLSERFAQFDEYLKFCARSRQFFHHARWHGE